MDKKIRPYSAQKLKGEITEAQLSESKTEIGAKILMCVTTVGVAFGAVGAIIGKFPVFLAALAVSEFCIFLGTGPIGMVLMSSVPPELRGQANAMAIFFMHLLGDFPSPFLIGALFGTIGRYWGMVFTIVWLSWAAFFWAMAWNISRFRGKSLSYMFRNAFKTSKDVNKESKLDFRNSETKI